MPQGHQEPSCLGTRCRGNAQGKLEWRIILAFSRARNSCFCDTMLLQVQCPCVTCGRKQELLYLCLCGARRHGAVLGWLRWAAARVGNFRQKNNSAEDGIDGTNGYFRRNSGGSAEQKLSEFPSEPFRGRENNSEFHSVEQK